MLKNIKLRYQDSLGTFQSAIIQLDDVQEVQNLETLPYDLQHKIIAGDYERALLDYDKSLTI